ncbi:MAG: NUMOD4 motif-containing HNH endonuclease [Clostridiales bacterium]|jgi:hypothetical protein|uniref:NUMOD4 motif-containing HNH endonuclease n=1 Tax=Zhenhengia sp. TaxID=2944208 RepID=UPI00204871FB|nr:NUMOD4 motif-containing HNH endonuclease [Clostridiales bacterium]DAY47826.1 MAG TPA: homing endonuclease [Caudoviricetes sp.]
MEIWKDIEGYEGLYQISSFGRVKSIERIDDNNHLVREKILKQQNNKFGYCTVGLYKNKQQKKFMVHRLVAQAFIPNVDNKSDVDHINTIRDDNRVDNLRWCTRKENINNEITLKKKKEVRIGFQYTNEQKMRMSKSHKGKGVGGKNPRAKKVMCGGITFDCLKDCAIYYDVKPPTMLAWISGRNKMPQNFKELRLQYVA